MVQNLLVGSIRWKHIVGHNPAVWAIVFIGLQGEFFDGREPNREATAEELKMLQYNAQACDILFNELCCNTPKKNYLVLLISFLGEGGYFF